VPTTQGSTRVLILSRQQLPAALLGMLLELDAFEPVYADPGERPEDALRRLRPLLMILLDAELETARSDLFFARAERGRIPVLIFGAPSEEREIRELAAARGLQWFTLPTERSELIRVLRWAIGPFTRGHDRRRPHRAFTAEDGTLIYQDRAGRHWQVYDRRGADRRGPRSTEPLYRVFVNESGEEWRFEPRDEDPLEVTPGALEQQLSRARLHDE
jgi:hypothetical protein